MKPLSWVGIILIVLGALIITYGGINYTRKKKVLDLGSVQVTQESHERFSVSPILGGLALAGGVVLLVMGAKKKS
ncbi:MAG TPA: DUF3185 domain-containing protein [Terriglobia bacterium]|nr:DUF3185 domain-containing protein [Terriglobia bacterium]